MSDSVQFQRSLVEKFEDIALQTGRYQENGLEVVNFEY